MDVAQVLALQKHPEECKKNAGQTTDQRELQTQQMF